MRWIIESSLKSRLAVVSLAIVVLFFAISQLREMQTGVFPEFSPVYVEVQTEALGLSADEVEQLLTVALEQDLLNGIAYLDEIWSESLPGLSRVVCVFEPGTDPMIARQVVAERLTQAHALPHVSKPPIMLQPYSSTSRVMKVGLSPSSAEMSLIDLSVLTRWTIQPYLTGIEGVANVSIWGQRKRQLQVQVDPQNLKDKQVTLHDVIKTTGEALWVSPLSYLNSSTPGTGGFFDTPNQRLGIRHLLPITTPEELAQIPVHGHDMVLGDVATVVENHQPLIGDAIVNGEPGILLVIEKFPWASTTTVTDKVEEALDALAPGLTGVAFDTEIYQPANFVEASFANFSTMLAISLVLVAFLLFLFLYEWRAALIGTSVIVLSLIIGAYVLFLRGVIFDMMLLAGFVVALMVIIDDAITTLSQIRLHLAQENQDGTEKSMAKLILDAVMEVRSPALFATLVLFLITLPLFFVEGVLGEFLQPLALSYLLALSTSTLVAWILTPALSLSLYAKQRSTAQGSPVVAKVTSALTGSIARYIQRPVLAYVTLAVLLVAGLLLIPMDKKGLEVPIPEERDMLITWDAEFGTSRPEMVRITKEAIGKIRTITGVNNAAAHIGRAVMSDKSANVHSGEIWLSIDDEADYDKTSSSIQQVLSEYPQINSDLMTYRQQSLKKAYSGTDHLYAVRVYGENQDIITSKAEEIQRVLSNISELENVKAEYPAMEPMLEIEVDLDKARDYNIKPGDVRRTAATLLAGIEVGSLFEGQKVFGVVVWGIPEVRNSIQAVKDLLVDIPTGGHVRLGDVAEVREKSNPAIIKREKVSRYIDVSFDKGAGSLSTTLAKVEMALQEVEFPLEYHAELIGQFEGNLVAQKRMWSIIIASLIGIFLLLQAALWSWRLALIVLPCFLLAGSGGVLGLFLSGGDLTLAGLAGFLAVFSLAIYQGLQLLQHLKRLELHKDQEFGLDLIIGGIHDRLPQILMSTIIGFVAFLPFALIGNRPGLEILHPMSLVVLGGLITTAVVNLFVLPALYFAFGDVSETVRAEEKALTEIDDAQPIVISS